MENELEKMIMKIITAMDIIGFDTKNNSIEDLLLNDRENINAVYKRTIEKFGNSTIKEKSYNFLFDLFNKNNGRTLFDVLENIYKDEMKIFNTNLQVNFIKEIRNIEGLEKELVIMQGIKDLLGD